MVNDDHRIALQRVRDLLHHQAAPDVFNYHAQRALKFQRDYGTHATIMRNRKTINGKVVSSSLRLVDFAERMQSRWVNMLPGFDPYEGLSETPDCITCNAL